jgi:beta-mannosidase
MVSEVAFYRLGAGRPENNLGALVWQLVSIDARVQASVPNTYLRSQNDIWQGVSWSSIEYSGRWKVLHYGESQIFSPVVIYPFWTAANETLEVYVISDRWTAVKGTAQLSWYAWNGTALKSNKVDFTVPSLNNSLVYSATGLDNIIPRGYTGTDVFLMVNLTADIDRGRVINEAVVCFFEILECLTCIHLTILIFSSFQQVLQRQHLWIPRFT